MRAWHCGDGVQIGHATLGNCLSLIDLDNHAFLIEKKGDGNGQVAASIVEMAVDEIVDAGDFLRGKQNREREVLPRGKGAGGWSRSRIIDIDRHDMQAA